MHYFSHTSIKCQLESRDYSLAFLSFLDIKIYGNDNVGSTRVEFCIMINFQEVEVLRVFFNN